MKQILFISTLIFIALFLAGCPFEAPFAIDSEPKENLDTLFLGKWIAHKETDDADNLEVEVFRFNEKEYFVEIKAPNEEEHLYFRAFLSKVKSKKIINFKCLNDNRNDYMYFSYREDGAAVYLSWLNVDHFKDVNIKNSKELKKYIKKNMGLEEFFETKYEVRLTRPEKD